jgi:UDP-glucose 4-epimerase
MMKVLGLTCGRKLSNTEILIKEALVGAEEMGTGQGYSVLEIVAAFEMASGRKMPYRIGDRRPGDIVACYADPALAQRELGWTARLGLAEMCADAWHWQSQNPNGYA